MISQQSFSLYQNREQVDILRQDAEAALNSIRATRVCIQDIIRDDQTTELRAHLLFLDLYYFTTYYWIEHSRDIKNDWFVFLLVKNFYSYYESYVAKYFWSDEKSCSVHWNNYFYWAKKFSNSDRASNGLTMLFYAAYAHTRFDLAEAIYDTFLLDRIFDRSSTQTKEIQHELLGDGTGAVFTRARQCFIEDRESACRDLLAPTVIHFIRHGSNLSEPFWLRRFQEWRQQAWREAITCLTNNTRPIRPEHC